MSIKKHPDYQEEKERLEYTEEYIEMVTGDAESNQEEYKENIKQAMIDLDYLDSSLSYINILTNAKFLEMTEKDYENLKKVRKKPYFSRIDFKPENSPKFEKLYLGKTSLYRKEDHAPIIVDWRSPIANLYYEGRIGEVSYSSQAGEIKGELSLKRQYTIEDGELLDFQDIDITTRDELLQKSLSTTKDTRLSDIVSTIQAEQNQIIRADMERPLIVQGVAGSGKTTIALHRVAYFIYTYAENFRPDQLMILAPNRLFINYISEVLPELGVEEVVQSTYVDFTLSIIGKKYKLIPDDGKLLNFIDDPQHSEDHDLLKWVSSFKGSLAFKKIIEAYVKDIEKNFIPEQDVLLDKYVIYRGKKIKRLFQKEYQYLPVFKRLDKLKHVLSSHLKTRKKHIVEKLEEIYDQKIENGRYTYYKDPKKRRAFVVKWMEAKEKRLNSIEKESKTLVKNYLAQFKKKDLFEYYIELITAEEKIHQYSEAELSKKNVHFLCKYSEELLHKKRIELEDTAALLYLKDKLYGIDDVEQIKNVVIDEAQDFSLFQLYALKSVLKTNLFTILGDLSQGIHSYRGINDWQEVIDGIFPKGNFKTLRQSYRTTIEIMNLANEVISQSTSPGIILAEPVVRHGDQPKSYIWNKEEELISHMVDKIKKIKKEGFKTIAIIGKTKGECEKINKLLMKKSSWHLQILQGDEEFEGSDVVIVPSYIAKGLEFDVVFVVTLDTKYLAKDLDIKLLYVAMTRPLHRLYIYCKDESIPLLCNVSNNILLQY